MFKNLVKRLVALTCIMSLSMVSIIVVNAGSKVDDSLRLQSAENSAITSCWTGFCGHKSTTYSYPGFKVSSTGKTYSHTGYHLNPGQSISESYSVSYTASISAGLEFGTDQAKASLGFSGSMTKSETVTINDSNNTNDVLYLHREVIYANRYNTITKGKRTYNPFYDLFGVNNYCEYSYSSAKPKGKYPVSFGLKLLTYIRNY